MSQKFKIQGVGIDTSTIGFKPSPEIDDHYDYIHTSISSNNDFIISDYVRSQPGASLVTTVDFTDSIESALVSHLLTIDRPNVDLLLIESTADWKNIPTRNVKQLKESGLVSQFGIMNPISVEQIEEYQNYLGEDIKYIGMDLCPLHFNYEVVQWCDINDIHIIGFNPFGGSITSSAIINSFSVPYLLGFSSNYCSVVFLSGKDLYLSKESENYLKDLVGKESSPKYTLKKSVSRLYKPIKKVVETSLVIQDNIVLSYTSPELMYTPEELSINLGKSVNIIPEIDKDLQTSIEKEVYNMLNILYYPEDASIEDLYACIRYQVLKQLKVHYPIIEGWVHNYCKLGDRILAISVVKNSKKKWWKGSKEEVDSYSFLLALPNKDNPLFMEVGDSIKNSAEKP